MPVLILVVAAPFAVVVGALLYRSWLDFVGVVTGRSVDL